MDGRKIHESPESGRAGSVEIERGDAELLGNGQRGGAEKVDDEGADWKRLGDFLERTADVGVVLTHEIEHDGGKAEGSVRISCGGGDAREEAEGNGGMGLGDAVDVGGDARGVGGASGGVENGDGEFMGVVLENELAELHHGDDVPHSWSCIEDYGVCHCYCVSTLKQIVSQESGWQKSQNVGFFSC